MPNPYLANAAGLLITLVFSVLCIAFLLRLLLQWARVDFHNPVCQLLMRVTQPVLAPLRRHIPALGPIDTATVLLLLVLKLLELKLLLQLAGHAVSHGSLLILAVAALIALLCNVYLVSLLLQAISSWLNTAPHPAISLLQQLNRPILAPLYRFRLHYSGIDFTPMLALLLLQLAKILIVAPLNALGLA